LSHPERTVGHMSIMGYSTGYRVRVDAKRRPTLPAALLAEAGIDTTHELIARSDGRGRIVLEDPLEVLAAFQNSVAEGMREVGESGSLVDDLLADRAADASTGD
jgi:bifunctional DNA-binding transcriptional regulator/antitoxin component of YhaV-PrlF toxin-antitoxin module